MSQATTRPANGSLTAQFFLNHALKRRKSAKINRKISELFFFLNFCETLIRVASQLEAQAKRFQE